MSEIDNKIALYEKLYKWALIIGILFIAIIASVGVSQLYVTSRKVDERTNEIQKSLRCISEFFTQTNRANLQIDDIKTCTLVRQ